MTHGDERERAEGLFHEVYDELHGLAEAFLRREAAHHTLQPTALVHEAYLRVLNQTKIPWKNPGHLRAVGARAMRRVLVDHARAKQAAKRGGGQRAQTLVSGILGQDVTGGAGGTDVLELEAALLRLGERSERQAQIIELRFFGGLTIPEVAEALGVSETTVEDDWRFARAWLARELAQ